MPGPQPGAGLSAGGRGTVSMVVTEADTAVAAGSGDVPVLATPQLLALAEAATVAAIARRLRRVVRAVEASVTVRPRGAQTPVVERG